jgi:hypothetical protein
VIKEPIGWVGISVGKLFTEKFVNLPMF